MAGANRELTSADLTAEEARRHAVGRCLKQIREVNNVSRTTLAGLSGTDRSDIGSLERGDHRVLLDTLWRILEPLGVKVSEFMASVEADLDGAEQQPAAESKVPRGEWRPPKPPKVSNNPYG